MNSWFSTSDIGFRSTISPTLASTRQRAAELQQPSRHGLGCVSIDIWPVPVRLVTVHGHVDIELAVEFDRLDVNDRCGLPFLLKTSISCDFVGPIRA